ncbi:hypothetical protein PFISCL1PPCAC_10213 [Pristionchus fissidentatus]|uniref:2-methoxy-6-polyprenyl-1,4-benzoquinol methylase, mitochondrial n=1 Tax=Pristionchus fissidentatus TaxID=1538716 RepID=A0AAV5VGZ1_9BILA|nr:hypothetical protein PFISCL1PPCAC_10213 [Pristionchus fissidentatus]
MLSRRAIQSLLGPSLRRASTHFGFEQVNEEEKADRVRQVFTGVADKYDLMNDAMSMGIHRLWKDYFVQSLPLRSNAKMLDVAGGTGDISFRALRRFPRAHVTVCDINEEMLRVGEHKAHEDKMIDCSRLSFVVGDGEKLPFEDNSFDAYTISFGIRNCTHVDQVVREAHRVLKPGGLFACLEFSQIHPALRQMYDLYSFQVIPVMGEVLAKDYNSYKYLVESIRRFPNQTDFSELISSTGLKDVRYENLSFGICAIHTARK